MKEDKIKYCLRLANISDIRKEKIQMEFPTLNFRSSNRLYDDATVNVLVFDLENNDLSLIQDMITDFEIEESDFDFFISLTTYKDRN